MKNSIIDNAPKIIGMQRGFYAAGKAYDIEFRINQLNMLKEALLKYKNEIVKAIESDFGVVGEYEAYGRIFFIIDEIKNYIKKLKKWVKPVKVRTPFMLHPGKSKYVYEPLGLVLIIGAWNAPFNVCLLPLIAAIGAGNCCVVKPSELAPESSCIIADIINSTFDEEYCKAITGGVEEVTELLGYKFDLICYTGGTKVGKVVYQAAAKQLTPVILELGGKSPCIVDDTANLKISAKRICQAKHMIAGQVCTSPDYLLVHSKIKKKFIAEMQKWFKVFYPDGALASLDYSKIINERNFDRLLELLSAIPKQRIVFGGAYDKQTLKIEPTIIDNVGWDDEIMQNEIFGPLIPIIEYTDLDKEITRINQHPKPLALYIYTKNKQNIEKIIKQTTSGGIGVNISIQHFLNRNLPFGGVGDSGIGRYRGRFGLYSFSNQKSVYEKSTLFETKLMDPPYGDKAKMMERFLG